MYGTYEVESGTFYCVWSEWGTEYIPAYLCEGTPGGVADFVNGRNVESVETVQGWGCRWTVPGCLDCGDWEFFESEEELNEWLADEDELERDFLDYVD